MILGRTPIRVCAIVALGAVTAWGCAAPPPEIRPPSTTQMALIGVSKGTLLNCAGPPLREIQSGETTVLTYHRDAPAIEESFTGSKSSVSRIHHSCTARLLLTKDTVDGVEYDSEPATFAAEDHCDEIFSACMSP